MAQFTFHTITRADIEESVGGAQMIFAIDYEGPRHLIVTGPPGSGKTTVSLMRAERLAAMGRDILFFTYHDLLWRSLKNSCSEELYPSVWKFKWWWRRNFGNIEDHYTEEDMLSDAAEWEGVDEIIIDEGQDLPQRVYRTFVRKCLRLTTGADNAQKVYSDGLTSQQIMVELGENNEPQHVPLGYNYRNTYGIYEFARNFLPHNEIVNNQLSIEKITRGNGERPTFFLVPDKNTAAEQLRILLSNAGERNTAVLVFNVEEVDACARLIRSIGFKCSKHHYKDHVGEDIENILVTTLQSSKGLEFEVVIMANMENAMNRPYKSRQHYFVACTRAKESLFLIGQGNDIPNCIRSFDRTCYNLIRVARTPHPPIIDEEEETNLPF